MNHDCKLAKRNCSSAWALCVVLLIGSCFLVLRITSLRSEVARLAVVEQDLIVASNECVRIQGDLDEAGTRISELREITVALQSEKHDLEVALSECRVERLVLRSSVIPPPFVEPPPAPVPPPATEPIPKKPAICQCGCGRADCKCGCKAKR